MAGVAYIPHRYPRAAQCTRLRGVDERPEGEGDAESRRRLTTRIAHIDEALRRWDAWDAWRARQDQAVSDARVGRRGSGANQVHDRGPAPTLPPLTRWTLLDLRAMLLEELDRLEQEL